MDPAPRQSADVSRSGSLHIAALSDLGRRRSQNEDSHAFWSGAPAGGGAPEEHVLLVADGMGGANAGEVASGLASRVVMDALRRLAGGDPLEALRDALRAANAVVYEEAEANPGERGMGTTCTTLVVRGERAWVGHVGDSRAYLVRGGCARRLTRDHTLVAELVERGHLTAQQAEVDPRRNQLTRCVGAGPDVGADVAEIDEPLRPGDTLVLCSDGLYGEVGEDEIAAIAGGRAPEDGCARLVELANERGGPDNITVLVARLPGEPPAPRGVQRLPGWMWPVALLALAAGWLLARRVAGAHR